MDKTKPARFIMENRVHSSKSGDTFSKKNRRGLTKVSWGLESCRRACSRCYTDYVKNFGLFHAAFLLTKIQGEQCLLMISERRTFSEIRCVFLSNALFRMRHLRVGVSVASVTRVSRRLSPLCAECTQKPRRWLPGRPSVPREALWVWECPQLCSCLPF